MKLNKTTIQQALTLFNISRASLYNHLKKLDIKPIREGRRVYLIDSQIDELTMVLPPDLSNLDGKIRQVGQVGQVGQVKKDTTTTEKIYKDQIKKLKKELKAKQEKIEGLIHEVGRWQGRANLLEEQNQNVIPGAWRNDKVLLDVYHERARNTGTQEGRPIRRYLGHYFTSKAFSVPWQDKKIL